MVTPRNANLVVLHSDPIQREYLEHAVQSHFHVYGAATIAEAVQQMARHHPVVIILEWDLPDGDGRGLIRQVRADPVLSTTVIACVPHDPSVKAKVLAFKAGADDSIVLPVATTFVYRLLLLCRVQRLSIYMCSWEIGVSATPLLGVAHSKRRLLRCPIFPA